MRRVADYFAQLNNKMGGDLKKIQTVGEYMVEIWKAVGMQGITDDNSGPVQFLSASEEINRCSYALACLATVSVDAVPLRGTVLSYFAVPLLL